MSNKVVTSLTVILALAASVLIVLKFSHPSDDFTPLRSAAVAYLLLIAWKFFQSSHSARRGNLIQVNLAAESLEEAVRRARAGDILVLSAGRFTIRGGVVVDKALTIRGAGGPDSLQGQTILQSWAKNYVIQFRGGGPWVLENLIIENVGNEPVNLVEVQGGEITIQRCRFTGAFFDKEGAPVRGGSGIWIRGDAIARVYQCLCDRNGLHGIEVSEKAQPMLEGNTCEKNTGSGIAYFGGAGGTARNNTCWENGGGIAVGEQAQPMLEGNTCEKNTVCGIAYLGSAGGTARNNTCRGNGYYGIQVAEQAQPMFEGNTCEKNTYSGIAYFGSAGGTARNNTCRDNNLDGIFVGEKAQPELFGNQCHGNRYGICVSPTAQPKLGPNRLFGNRLGDLGRE